MGPAGAANLQAKEAAAAARTALALRETAGSILYPGDLLPLTRKPLCLVVDSDSSAGFAQVVSPFGTPVRVVHDKLPSPTSFLVNWWGGLELTKREVGGVS